MLLTSYLFFSSFPILPIKALCIGSFCNTNKFTDFLPLLTCTTISMCCWLRSKKLPLATSGLGFLNLRTYCHFRRDGSLSRGCPWHCRMQSSIPGLYLLEVSSIRPHATILTKLSADMAKSSEGGKITPSRGPLAVFKLYLLKYKIL